MGFRRTAALALTILVLAACKPRESEPQAPITPVAVRAATLEEFRPSTAITGEVRARSQTDLSFRVSGRVTERSVDVGQRVEAGQVLARLDPEEQVADVAAAQAGVDASQAQLDQSRSEFERQQTLFQQGLTTRSVFEQAQEAVRTAQASLDASQAQRGTAQDTLTYTELRATAPGVVTERSIEVGQVVQAAETAFSIAEDGPRDAVFQVYERLLFERPESEIIDLSLATDPTVTATGRIREISPAVDTDTGTVRVKVAIDNVPPRMSLGSAVVGRAERDAGEAVIVPWSALASDEGKPAVWIVDPQTSETALRKIVIAAYETGRIVLSAGVEPGELVVIDGTKFLRPGERIQMMEGAS